MIPTARLEEIRELAAKATPGPWVEWSEEGETASGLSRHSFCKAEGVDDPNHECIGETPHADPLQAYHNADFIAASNPQTISAIVSELIERRNKDAEHVK